MKLTIKLNIEEFQNLDCETNDYDTINQCYPEILDFLEGWVDYAPKAVRLRNHIVKILEGKVPSDDDIVDALHRTKGEKSAGIGETPCKSSNDLANRPDLTRHSDSKPLPKVVETQNFVDVRECIDYSKKSYKLVGYDMRETYIAKQHVIRTESIEGGGTRVIVSTKSAWVIGKLE